MHWGTSSQSTLTIMACISTNDSAAKGRCEQSVTHLSFQISTEGKKDWVEIRFQVGNKRKPELRPRCLITYSKYYRADFHQTCWKDGRWARKEGLGTDPDKRGGCSARYALTFSLISRGVIHESWWKEKKQAIVNWCHLIDCLALVDVWASAERHSSQWNVLSKGFLWTCHSGCSAARPLIVRLAVRVSRPRTDPKFAKWALSVIKRHFMLKLLKRRVNECV